MQGERSDPFLGLIFFAVCLHCLYMKRSPSVWSRCTGRPGFTLLELLVVVAIIVILAGLTLGTLGYVNRKGAESRARAEVAALAAAIDSYKLDFGAYPATNTLFRELTGRGTVNSNKVFIEPTPGMFTNEQFVDPWGTAYQYRIGAQATNNVGFFDLWTSNNAPTNAALWIRN